MLLLLSLQIAWGSDLDAALAQAKTSGRPVLLFIVGAGSDACARMEKDIFGDAATSAFSAKTFVHVRLDALKDKALADRHGVSELPATVLLATSGERITRLEGYHGPEGYKEAVEAALAAWARLQALEPKLKDAAPALWAEAAALRAELGDRLRAAAAYRRAAGASPAAKDRGGWLVKAFNELNAAEADDAVTGEIRAVAGELDALDPALGFADDAAYARAMADYNTEDWDAAIAKLEALVARWPDADRAPLALMGLGDLYHHAKKDHKKAVERIQRVIDRWKGTAWAERAKHFLEHIEAHAGKED
jgi:tetratricopeptide (TPR) repeat protein